MAADATTPNGFEVPRNESERLQALRETGLLDTGSEESFDRFTRMASDLLGFPIAALNLVDADRQWTKSAVGMANGDQCSRSDSLCSMTIVEPTGDLLVPDTHEDPRLEGNAQVADGLRCYAGVALVDSDGHSLGSFCVGDTEPREIGPRETEALHSLAAAVMTELELRRQNARLSELTRIDPLTGLYNRRALSEELDREIARARRAEVELTVAMIDIDHFKLYNDTYGHQGGDDLLRKVSHSWRSAVRTVDLVARFGGEEFTFAFPNCGEPDAIVLVERLRAMMPEGQTCSAGVALWDRFETGEDLLGRADKALYAAKDAGRDRVRVQASTLPA